MIHFTEHAAARYVERVNPNLTVAQALKLLPALAEHGTVGGLPDWAHPSNDLGDADAWLVIGDIAFALTSERSGLRATTCIPRGAFSAKIAQRRHDRKVKRTRARFARDQNWGSAKPPPSELAA